MELFYWKILKIGWWKQTQKKTLSFIFTGIVKPLENIVFLSSSAVVRKSIPLLFLLLPQSLLFSFFHRPEVVQKWSFFPCSQKRVSMVTELGKTEKKRYKVRKREIVVERKNSRKVCVCVSKWESKIDFLSLVIFRFLFYLINDNCYFTCFEKVIFPVVLNNISKNGQKSSQLRESLNNL